MDETVRHQRDTALGQLDALIEQGREIRNAGSVERTRAWQRECASAVNQLSGGSKAHWLARAYSDAFMVRSADRAAIVEADSTEIADRILDVLAQGAASLSGIDDAQAAAAPRPRVFEFVVEPGLRPVIEQALDDSRRALQQGEFALSLILSCGIIDALLTDALARGPAPIVGQPAMTFDMRIAAARRAGLITDGCARLPPVARAYRDLTDANGDLRPGARVAERDARVAGQVLRVVMRDLDPGR